MPKVKTYKVGEQVFDIPESETSSFLKDNPNAIQLQSFVNGKDTFDIPLPEVDLFLKDNPKATPLYKEDTQKKKEEAESSSELSGGQLSLSEEGKNKPIGEGGIDVSNDIYLYSPTPNENKIKALVPELQDKIMQAKEYAKQDPSLKLDIAQSIIDADTFGGNIVGKASKDGTYYVDINNKPLKNFKEGNILIVPKKGDQDSGFIQLLKNEDGDLNWVKVQAPDPSFSVAKQNPTEDVVVTGYKELQRPKYIQELEKIGKNIYGEDFFIPRDESVTPEEWQKNVDQLGPLSQEFALYNKDNDKGQVLPKFLNAHPDIRQSLEQVLQETPTQLESTKGRNEALTKAVEKTYRLQEQPVNPFAVEDASQFIDAPAFYKNLQLLTNTHNQLKELQEKENLLKDNPKYHNQYTSIQKDIEKLSNNLQPIVQFFQEPNNKRVIDRLEANDALFATQKQGSDVVASLGQFFPKQKAENIREMNARYEANRDPKTMTKEALLDNIENKQFAPIKAAWGAAKNALMDIGASAVGGGFSVGMGNESDRREFRSAIDELKSNVKSYTYVPNLDIRGPNGELLVGNAINNFVKDLGKMTGELAPAMIGGSNKIASSLIFGFQGYQNAKETAKASGMHSDAEASLYALFNGAMMGAIGYGLGGKFGTAAKEFTPSAEAVAMAIAPATREAGVKAILGEMYQGGLKDILKGATKGSIEMKIAGVAEALHNELWNKYRGDLNKFPTEVGGIMDDIKNFAAFAIQQAGMTALGKKGMSNKEKEAVKDYAVLRASQDNPKEVIEALDKLRNLPNADIDNIDAAKDAVLSLTIKNFPKDTTPEQKVELSKQAQIIAEATKEKESIDKEYHAPYNEVIKDANTKIEEILKNPKKVEKEVQENVKPVVEEINKTIAPDETTHPIGEVGHNDAVFNDKKVKEENKNTNEQGDKVDKPIDTKNVGGTEEKVSKPADETEPVKEEINKDQRVSKEEVVNADDKKKDVVESSEKRSIYIQKPPIKPPKDGEKLFEGEDSSNNKRNFDKLTNDIPNSGNVKKYLSGDTIRKYEKDEPRNNQEIIVQELKPALEHGVKIVEKAKELFGDKYVEKTLEYLDSEKLDPANKALIYVSLENKLAKEKLNNPDRINQLNKLQDLIRTKSQAFLRSSSLAINMGRLRKFAEAGYDISQVTDRFFSTKELKAREDIEKAIQSDADTINKEDEIREEEKSALDIEIENKIVEGIEKEIDKIYQALPKQKKINADRAIAALERIQKKLRGKLYDAALGVPLAIIDAGITTIKHAIKAGVSIANAVELGIVKIKEKYGKKWDKEDVFREDYIKGFKEAGIKEDADLSKIVKDALISEGFSKTINIKGEKKQILDWKKLAGEEGSIDKIKENVEKSLKGSGYSDDKITEMQEELIGEYNSLRASVIEKSLNELAKRNKETITPEQKTAAKKLAELYNYGLFDQKKEEFDNLINKAIGASVSKEGFEEANKIAKAMQQLYASSFNGVKLNDITAKTAIQQLENRMRILLSKEASKEGTTAYKIASIAKSYMDISQTMVLNSLKQAVENPLSGAQQNAIESISGLISKDFVGSKSLDKQRRKMMQSVYKDMILNAGVEYGDVGSAFANRGKIDDYLNKLSDQKLYHGIVSGLTGKATLDGMDAMYKLSLTEKKFAKNLIKILTNETNKNRMSKEDAVKFVSEQLTGQTLEDAKKTATEIIEKINKDAGDNLLPSNKEAVDRLANDIVKSALEMGGKITSEQIIAAYKAAYKAAGLGLGHEANNPISKMVGHVSAKIQKDTNHAIKEKDWNKAALLTTVSTIWRNILNPFVGGGTNWLVLKLEKNGLGLFTGLGYNIKDAKDKRIDLSSEEGSKKLEDALYKQARIKDNYMRGIVGGGAALLTYLAFLGIASTEDYRDWRNRNKWAAKYLDLITPEFLLADMANKNGEVKKYLENVFNKNDAFDSSTKLINAAGYFSKGESNKGWGALGESFGEKFNLPIPWRVVKDAQILYQGITGQDPYHGNYKPSTGFFNGVFKGGAIEWFGMRPKGAIEKSIYNEDDLNDPALKPFVENDIDLPKVSAKFIEIEDRVDGKPKLKKLSDYGEEKIKTFEEEKKKFLKKILTRQHGYAFVDRYGRYSLTAGDGGKKRVKIESITNNEEKKKALKEVLRQASSQSTEQAKEKLFPNR